MTNNSRDRAGPNAIKSLLPKVSVCPGTGVLTDTHRDLAPVVNSVNSSNVCGSALRICINMCMATTLKLYMS